MRTHIYIHGAAGITQDLVRFARLLLGAALMVYINVRPGHQTQIPCANLNSAVNGRRQQIQFMDRLHKHIGSDL